jgi:hypothetical protein
MVLSDFPTCTPVTNTVATITCSYDENTGILLVKNAFGGDIPVGSLIEFDMNSFRNPYSGKPRDGFWVKTTDAVGGEIDSSLKSGLLISF